MSIKITAIAALFVVAAGPVYAHHQLVITSPSIATATVGKPFLYRITASGSPTSFSASGLPAGLTVNPDTGVISGTPTKAGTSVFRVSATNPRFGTVTLTVAPAGGPPPPPPPPPPPVGECGTQKASGPVVAQTDGQVISNLAITATSAPGIDTNGKSGVQIKNVTVHHNGAHPGILVDDSSNVAITGVDVIYDGAPASGKNPSDEALNIGVFNSPSVTITDVRLSKGSTGIFLQDSPGSKMSFIEGYDHKGPFPRGQLVQWNRSNNGSLTDFSSVNNVTTSWTEDNVNVFDTRDIVIARGLVDGNNSPSGVGVIVDGSSGRVSVTDVDAVHQGNGCFSVYGGPAHDVTFTNARCRDNHCSNPRGKPLSNSLAFAFDPAAGANLNVVKSSYFNLCNPSNVVWDEDKLTINEITEKAFTPRAPIKAKLCQ